MYNTLCKGKIAVAKSNYIFKNTGIRVIKPMVYCTTKELNDFCQQCNLPIIPFNIPYCFKKSRHLEMISLGIDRFVG